VVVLVHGEDLLVAHEFGQWTDVEAATTLRAALRAGCARPFAAVLRSKR
jgi:hypothetical protein